MKKLIIFHSKDTDGFMSGALLNNLLKAEKDTEVVLVGYNREQPEDYRSEENHQELLYDNIVNYNEVYVTDILMDTKWFIDYVSYINVNCSQHFAQKIIIFDHHMSAVSDLLDTLATLKFNVDIKNKELINFVNNFLDIDIHYTTDSATKIVWNFLKTGSNKIFVENHDKETIINFLSEYDTWEWQTKYDTPNFKALYLEYYLRNKYTENLGKQEINAYANILEMLIYDFFRKDQYLDKFIEFGKNIFEEKLKLIKNNGIVPIKFGDKFRFMLVFNEKPDFIMQHHIKEISETLYSKYYFDGILFLSFDEEKLKASVRQINKSFDCNEFCRSLTKEFNETTGGGHFGAAGFTIKNFKNINKFMLNIEYGIS